MNVQTSMRMSLSVMAMIFAHVPLAQASALRTFVSSAGSDTNTAANCPRANPCRTFGAAYGVTVASGEIVALDSAGYGPLTITTAVTVKGLEGAFVAVAAGTIGITINAGTSDLVILRNLEVTGAGAANTTGIQLNNGRLIIKGSSLARLTTGLSIAANTKSDVVDTDMIGNGTGISTTGEGSDPVGFFPPYGPTQVRISGGTFWTTRSHTS
ncbi:MAG: hypothetical protein QOI12_2233 [Alphaproteobacteria bacterium]|jgi:hypothetical protein|nr:hypothetical protein [Alphaproteobacteria bacterium]